jgi:hypothetical protein
MSTQEIWRYGCTTDIASRESERIFLFNVGLKKPLTRVSKSVRLILKNQSQGVVFKTIVYHSFKVETGAKDERLLIRCVRLNQI